MKGLWGRVTLISRYKKMLVTTNPTREEYFDCFIKGENMLTGVTRIRDFVLYLEDLHDSVCVIACTHYEVGNIMQKIVK